MSRWMPALLLLAMALPARAEPAPDFTLRDINGANVALSQHKGKVVVMSFWATWCGPCKEEMPHLQAMYDAKKDAGLVVLSISTDDARSASKVKPYIQKMGYGFPVLLDKESAVIATHNPSKTVPFTVVVDRAGQVHKRISGYNPGDETALAALVDELLAAPAP
jgi:peroxiredoxin